MAEADSLPRHLEFEATFALDPDPWDYGSEYEQRKYEHALGLLPERVGDALELGCAGGFFTELLAPRAERVLACDISLVALSAAARRCRGLENVAFSRLDLFADQIPQGYDLVVCSETLYYAADRDQLDETLGRIAGALSPGGHLLTANAHVLADDEAGAGFDWDVPFGARGIGGAIGELGCLDLVEEVETEAYRVQLYRKRSGPRFIRRLRRPRRRSILHGEMTLQAGERFRRDGGTVRREERERNGLQQTSLPILMYHQIAETGAEKTRQWRTTPADFAAQLEFLRGAGYYSLSFDDWRTATKARQAPPGKPIILTFDDGYVDFRETAAPLLREYGFTANLFVVSDLVGTASTWDEDLGEPAPLMGWDEIQQVAGQGFGIGSHSARHRALVTLELGELASDLARSRHLLEARLGRAVTAISYPYGLYDQKVATAAAASGFQFGVTTDGARAPWSAPLLALPRLEVQGGASLEDFALLLEP
jgi:peptidoglycan/xylan/chitin deacetylase (PgdA/CDA1 family)